MVFGPKHPFAGGVSFEFGVRGHHLIEANQFRYVSQVRNAFWRTLRLLRFQSHACPFSDDLVALVASSAHLSTGSTSGICKYHLFSKWYLQIPLIQQVVFADTTYSTSGICKYHLFNKWYLQIPLI